MKIKYIFLLFIQTEGVLSVLLWMGECVNTKVIWTYIQILFLFSPFFISAYTFFFFFFKFHDSVLSGVFPWTLKNTVFKFKM